MVGVATRYGETGPTPYLLPISVDGLIIVASISLIELGARIRHLHTTTTTSTSTSTGAADSGTTTGPVTGTVTTPAQPTPTNGKASGSPAVTIPAQTAQRLAATYARPTPPPPPPAHNHRSGAPVQESLL